MIHNKYAADCPYIQEMFAEYFEMKCHDVENVLPKGAKNFMERERETQIESKQSNTLIIVESK